MNRSALTLVEVLVATTIVAIMSAIGVAAYSTYETAGMKSLCLTNLRAAESAKGAWASDHPARYSAIQAGTASATLSDSDLAPYYPNNGPAPLMPVCPSVGIYSNSHTIGVKTSCSLHGSF